MARKDKAPDQPAAPAAATGRPISLEQAMAMAYQHWNTRQAAAAERLCQQVLAVSPNHPDALHLMGVMAHAYGKADLAIEFLTRACTHPGVPPLFHSNLAEMCRQAKRLAEAEDAGRKAVAHANAPPQAWNNLGIVLQERGKLEEALDCLNRTITLKPDYAEAHSNLGNTLMKLSRLTEAERAYEQALSINPDSADAHSNFSSTLIDLGRFDEARSHAERAITLNPQTADAHANLAMIEARFGRKREALTQIDAALGLMPDNIRLLLARTDILKKLNRLDDALANSNRTLALWPEDGEAHNVHGLLLQALGCYPEALAALDKAVPLLPRPASAVGNKAVALMEMGRHEAALVAFDEALRLQPDFTAAWFNRADLKKFMTGDPDIAAMAALLAPDAVQSHDERMALHFALGKAYLDTKDAEAAFRHLDEGNRMKRATIDYDADETGRWMDAIVTMFPAERMRRFAQVGAESEVPVFVLGMPRSGTTLVEQVLAAHPEVHGAGELPTVSRLVGQVHGPGGTVQPYPGFIEFFRAPQFEAFGRQYLAEVTALAPGQARIIDKMPANFLYAGLIHLALPGARIIHCRRDPLDTCLSCYSKLFSAEQNFAYDLVELGRFHRGYQRLSDHWRAVLPATSFIEIDYAEMVEDLEASARRLIDFLGLAWNEACLDFHRSDRPVRTASMNQVRQPIYRSSLGRAESYRNHLAPLIDALGLE
ncbi:MAG TPA: sulfotransferase [Stellaceae bacterium]|nr:sulfotransferase [Stellaceae bacterium]